MLAVCIIVDIKHVAKHVGSTQDLRSFLKISEMKNSTANTYTEYFIKLSGTRFKKVKDIRYVMPIKARGLFILTNI